MLLHVLRHVDADDRRFGVEEDLRQRLGQLRFAHARRPKENEAADRPAWVLDATARPQDRFRNERDRFLLPDDTFVPKVPDGYQRIKILRHATVIDPKLDEPAPENTKAAAAGTKRTK